MRSHELSNYEVDIGDEPITELCKSERDCEVTSERQYALCICAADVQHNKCVAEFDLNVRVVLFHTPVTQVDKGSGRLLLCDLHLDGVLRQSSVEHVAVVREAHHPPTPIGLYCTSYLKPRNSAT